MAQQEGPFSSYLDYMQKPIAPAPTGLEGTGMGIANIAMNFLQGLRQGRAQKYMQKEAEENRKEQLLLNAMQTIQKSDMLPEDKAQYEARIQQEFAKRVAGVKEGSKDTGNPLTDFFKRAGMSLVGGQPPGGKKADIDMNVALEAFAAASDPSRSKTRFIADLDRQADELIRGGMQEAASKGAAASYETFFSGDRGAQLNALIDKARRLGAPLPTVEKTRSEYRPLTQDEITKQKRYEQAQGIKSKIQTEGYQPNLLDLEILHAADGLRHPVSKEGMFLTKEGEHVRGFVTQSPYINQGRPLVLGENNQPLDYVRQVGAAERISPAELERVSAKPIQYIMNIPGIPAEQLKDYANRVKAAVSIGGPQASQDVARAHADAVKFAADYRERVAKEKAAEVAANKRLSEEQRDRLEGIFKSITSDDKYKWKNIYDNIAAPALQRASRRPSSLTEQAADDILLIRAIAKLTDITTGVREGEYNTFADVNSKYANFVQGIQNIIGEDGQAREILTAPARAAYVNKLKELNDNASKMYNALLNKAENQAREFKIDPGAIRRVFTLGDISQYTPTTSTPPGGESVVGRGAVVSPRSPVVKQPNPFRK